MNKDLSNSQDSMVNKHLLNENKLVAEQVKKVIKLKASGSYAFDETKTYFLKIGGCMNYSDVPHFLLNVKTEQQLWAPIDDPDYSTTRSVNLQKNVMETLRNNKIKAILDKVGIFITYQNKWGFLLYLDSLDCFYSGKISPIWNELLQAHFIQDLIRHFAFYNRDERKDITDYRSHINPTSGEKPINPNLVPFNDLLFLHQKQEISWMMNLELNPNTQLIHYLNVIPFFDTEFFINLNNPTRLIQKHQLKYEHIYLPGGVLASRVGSGKTISIIGLITTGKQIWKYETMSLKQKSSFIQDEEEKIPYDEIQKYSNGKSHGKQNYKGLTKSIQKIKKELKPYYLTDNIDGPSLIVVTKNILFQWKEELERFAPRLKVFLAADVNELKEAKNELLGKFRCDVLLTHREVLAEVSGPYKYLYSIHWRRVIFDEFHEISAPKSKDSKFAAFKDRFLDSIAQIKRDFTWGVTGTPEHLDFSTGIQLLFNLLNYDKNCLNINNRREIKDVFFKHCIRQNVSIEDLPPLEKDTLKIQFGQMQQLFYKSKLQNHQGQKAAFEICSHLLPEWRLLSESERDQYKSAAVKIQQKQFFEIESIAKALELDPDNKVLKLKLEVLNSEENFYAEMIKVLSQEVFSSPICLEEEFDKDKIVVTDCFHVICEYCWNLLFQKLIETSCPMCKQTISEKSAIIHPRFGKKKREQARMSYPRNIKSTRRRKGNHLHPVYSACR